MKRTVRKLAARIRLEKEFLRAYALGALFNLLTFPVYMTTYYFLWSHVYAASGGLPMELDQLLVYYGTIFFVGSIVPGRGFAGSMARSIVRGRINSDLVRPMGLQEQALHVTLSRAVVKGVIFLPTLLFTVIVFGGRGPLDLVSFALLLLPAFFVSFFVYSLLWETAFWTGRIRGCMGAFSFIIRLFSGALIPLSFFPEWFKSVSGLLPFEFMAGLPARALLGGIGFQQALILFVVGMAWAGALYTLTRFMLSRGLRRYSGHGA